MKVFFSDYGMGDHVSPDAPREVSLEEALALFDDLSDEEGCFFGLIDDDSRVVQFMYEKDGNLLIDVPLADQQGSLKRGAASFEECRRIIIGAQRSGWIEAIPGLTFEPW